MRVVLIFVVCVVTLSCGGSQAVPPTGGAFVPSQLSASPASVNFGQQPVGESSGPRTVRLSSTGGAVTVTSLSVSGPFSVASPALPVQVPSEPVEIAVTFTPTAIGSPGPARLTIVSNAANSSLQVDLVGEGLGSQVAASPGALDFAQQTVGTVSAPRTLRLTNTGNASLVLQAIQPPAGFALGGPALPLTLPPAQSADFSVAFSPTQAQPYGGALSFVSNSPVSSPTVSLAGAGVTDTVVLNVFPTAVSFGNQTMGTTSSPRNVTLANGGAASLVVDALAVEPGSVFRVLNWSGEAMLLPGQALPLDVTFSPGALGGASGTLRVSSNAPDSPRTVALAGTGVVIPDDIVLPTLYNTFVPPLRGQSYTDPAFGTTVTRLSDGPVQFGLAVHHEYSSMSPFNSNNSRILLVTGKGQYFTVDPAGNVLTAPGELGIGGLDEPRWSRTDPNVIYYHKNNQLLRRNLADGSTTVLRTFSQYSGIDFCRGEGDLSEDGDHLAVCGDKRYIHVYQISANALSPALDASGIGYDWFDMTPNNNVIGHLKSPSQLALYDKNMSFVRVVVPYVGHNDRGRDSNGDEIIVIIASNDLSPAPGCEGNGIVKVRLSDSQKTCILPLYWFESTHVSLNNSGGHPWVLVSNTHTKGTAEPPVELPLDWESQWGPYYNELTLVKLDGSEVRRLAHHRSRRYNDYWYAPRAVISGDGTLVIFDSTHALSAPGVNEYTDAYLISVQP